MSKNKEVERAKFNAEYIKKASSKEDTTIQYQEAINLFEEQLRAELERDISNIDLKEIEREQTEKLRVYSNIVKKMISSNLDLLDKESKKAYLEGRAEAYTEVIFEVFIGNNSIKSFLDNKKLSKIITLNGLENIQEECKALCIQKNYDINNLSKENLKDLKKLVFDACYKLQEDILNTEIALNRAKYEEKHSKYKLIEKLLDLLFEKYKNRKEQVIKEILNQAKEIKEAETTKQSEFIPVISKKYTVITNKIFKQLTALEDNVEHTIDLQLSKDKTPTNAKVQIKLNEDFKEQLTAFDKLVLNNAFTLWENGNKLIGADLIYNEFTGNTEFDNIGADIENSINQSILKLWNTKIKFNFDDITKQRISNGEDFFELDSVEESILPLRKINLLTNKKDKIVFQYIKDPDFFIYSKSQKQIKNIDRELLCIGMSYKDDKNQSRKHNLTKERMLILDYISRRYTEIKSMSKAGKVNNKLQYMSLFDKCELFKDIDKELEVTTDNKRIVALKDKRRKYKNRYITEVKRILDEYKQKKFIKDYAEYPKESKTKEGIELIFK